MLLEPKDFIGFKGSNFINWYKIDSIIYNNASLEGINVKANLNIPCCRLEEYIKRNVALLAKNEQEKLYYDLKMK